MKFKYNILIFILVTCSVFCEPDHVKLSKYEKSLAVLYSAYTGIKLVEEICTKSFPKYKERNSNAYNQWEIKYQDFLNEINHHWINYSFENSVNKKNEIDLELGLSNFIELTQMVRNKKNK